MTLSASLPKLEAEWKRASKAYSLEKCEEHLITKVLLSSNVLRGSVISVGCGMGYRMHIAQENTSTRLFGVDIAWYPIQRAKKEMPHLRIARADALRLPFPDRSFDNALLLATIEHIKDTTTLLSEIKRVLRWRGKLLVSVTQNDYHGSPMHVHKFNAASLQAALSDFKTYWIRVQDHIIFALVATS